MEVEVAGFMKRSYEMKISFFFIYLLSSKLYLVNDNLFVFVLCTFLVLLILTRIYTLFYVFFFFLGALLIRRRRRLSNSNYF